MDFGTDGIRMQNVEELCRVGYGMGVAQRGKSKIVLAEDNRPTSRRVAAAVAAGLEKAGCDVLYAGVAPIAAMQYAVRYFTADGGIMVTASHNPPKYNGLKYVDADGRKPSDEELSALAAAMEGVPYAGEEVALSPSDVVAKAYLGKFRAMGEIPLRVAVDCANGAAYPTVKRVFVGKVRDAVFLHHGEGKFINRDCGALHPETLLAVEDADMGFALDGDGDRCVAVTRGRRIVRGDEILYLLAKYYRLRRMDLGAGLASTVMANGALGKALSALGLRLYRTDVGDRNVWELMQARGCVLGGEPSGHILAADGVSDGIMTGLTLAGIAAEMDLDEALADYRPWPQYHAEVPLTPAALRYAKAAEAKWQDYLGETGRVVVRASGTEPVVRVMVECESMHLAENIAVSIVQAAKKQGQS